MRGSEVYLNAAKLIDSDDAYYSCNAVYRALASTEQINNYVRIFYPPRIKKENAYWGKRWGNDDEQKACRVLALLLMSAIAESEEKERK